jgi:hypothetical protein
MEEDRAPLIVCERTQWILAGVHPHGIRFSVRSRGCILKIVRPVSFGHPEPFDPAKTTVFVPIPVAFPDVRCLEAEEVFGRADELPQVRGVEFDAIYRAKYVLKNVDSC